MRECVDCGRHFTASVCPGCGWKPKEADKEAIPGTRAGCCLCREPVSKSGWCLNCRLWPINITPIRWCERAHRVHPDGFCAGCVQYVATRLEPQAGSWHDTREVAILLSREENHRRLQALLPQLDALLLAHQPAVRDVQAEKRALAEWEAKRAGQGDNVQKYMDEATRWEARRKETDEVPF